MGPSWLRAAIRAVLAPGVIQNVFGMGVGRAIDRLFGRALRGLGGEFVSNGLECHYPLLQIVDGEGNRTKYYADYLAYVNNGTTCEEPSFECPVNRAPGTVLLGRLVA